FPRGRTARPPLAAPGPGCSTAGAQRTPVRPPRPEVPVTGPLRPAAASAALASFPPRIGTPSVGCRGPLRVPSAPERLLLARLEAARQGYNACLRQARTAGAPGAGGHGLPARTSLAPRRCCTAAARCPGPAAACLQCGGPAC